MKKIIIALLAIALLNATPVFAQQQQTLAQIVTAARNGDLQSINLMGFFHKNGNADFGMPVNIAEAKAWFEIGASKGYAPSVLNLGLLYETGAQGIPKDIEKARAYYTRAANLGNAYAQKRLAALPPKTAALVEGTNSGQVRTNSQSGQLIRNGVLHPEIDRSTLRGYYFSDGGTTEQREHASRNLESIRKDALKFFKPTVPVGGALGIGKPNSGLWIHFSGLMRVGEDGCMAGFRIVNRLGFDLRRNGINFMLESPNENYKHFPIGYVNDESKNVVMFDNLKNDSYIDTLIFISNDADTCVFNYERRAGNGLLPFETMSQITFFDESAAIADGVNSAKIFNVSGGPSEFKFGKYLSNSLNYTLRLQDPVFQAAEMKRRQCNNSCQQQLESCAMRYGSSASQVCGVAVGTCFNQCQ